MKEQWKDLQGFEQYYLISNTGKIYSKRKKRELKLINASNGYKQIRLYHDKHHREQLLVHRLVFENFVRKLLDTQDCHHLDGNKKNNEVTNLVAMDSSQHRRLHMNGNSWNAGKPKNDQWKAKVSKAMTGKKHSQQTKKKMSRAKKEWWRKKHGQI